MTWRWIIRHKTKDERNLLEKVLSRLPFWVKLIILVPK